MGELEAKYAMNNMNGFNGNGLPGGAAVGGGGGTSVVDHKSHYPANASMVHFQSPYAMTNIEKSAAVVATNANEERYPLNHLNLSPMKSATTTTTNVSIIEYG